MHPFVDGTIESNWTDLAESFDQMNLHEPLLRGIYSFGFERPSAIQQRAIKPCIMGESETSIDHGISDEKILLRT